MTFSKSSPRRGVATVAAVLVGMVGSTALAVPASAADTRITVTGSASCDRTSGFWRLTVTAKNNSDQTATIVDHVGMDYSSPTIAPQGTVTYHDSVPGTVTTSLEGGVTVTWPGSDAEVGYSTSIDLGGRACDVDTKIAPPNDCVSEVEAALGMVSTPQAPNLVFGLTRRLCPGLSAQGALATYTMDPDGTQHRYDSQVVTVDNAHPIADFGVAFPPCSGASYVVTGAEVFETIAKDADPYGGRKLMWDSSAGASYRSCAGVPALTFTTRCDGTVTTTVLTSADETFTFTGGKEYTATVKASAGVPLTVEVPSAVGNVFYVRGEGADDFWRLLPTKPNTCSAPLQATISSSSDCNVLKLEVHNPGSAPVTAYLTMPSRRESEVIVQPGTTYSTSWDSSRVAAVTVQAVDEVREILYKHPASCPAPPYKRLTGIGKWKIN